MDRSKVAAHFVAFTYYLNSEEHEGVSLDEAGRLARENWAVFLPLVGQELEDFLAQNQRRQSKTQRGQRRTNTMAKKTPCKVAVAY
jgi:hypothetical protein